MAATMELGAVFPQNEIGDDPVAVKDYAQAAEQLGFTHLVIYDHVLGADRDRPGGFSGPYDKDTPFHEPFVTFGYLAAHTSTIQFVTCVIILPQRQTALAAKQAAQVDLLSGGRLTLGVGTGWNAIEYEALNENFHNRGKRQEEQVALMRELWTKDVIDFEGHWHRINKAGINPRPARPIPIWFGGSHPAVLERAARIGDGWMPVMPPNNDAKQAMETLRSHRSENGKDMADFGVQAQAQIRGGNPDLWQTHAETWRELGATHLAIATMGAGLESPQDHIDAIRGYKEALG